MNRPVNSRRVTLRRAGLVATAAIVLAGGCDPDGSDGVTSRRSEAAAELNATVVVHAVEPSTPTPEGLAYVRAVADVLARAEASSGDERIQILRRGLSLPVPAGLAEAEILRLELAATLGETLLQRPEGAAVAHDLLAPMLPVERSLPMDRATARALVALGDASAKMGRDALAAGSYGRALRVMSLLRQELTR